MYLVKSNLSSRTRPTKKIKITNKIFGIVKDKNKIAAMTLLQQVLKFF